MIDEYSDLLGRYGESGTPGIDILRKADGFSLHMPGAPNWMDTPLVARKDNEMEVTKGPLKGIKVSFSRDARNKAAGLKIAGMIGFPRHPDPNPPDYVVSPAIDLDESKIAAFNDLYARYVQPGQGREIYYDLSYPRYEFLIWACDNKQLLLHGSNKADIEEFSPKRQTLGRTHGQSDRGVSSCSDALWAMAYAILDRSRITGAFHNGGIPFHSRNGTVRLYHFSISEKCLHQQPPPFTRGAVYLFSPTGFSRVAQGAFGPESQEWSCPAPVRPLAYLRVAGEDFPLLDNIHGHDDSRTQQFLALRNNLFQECEEAIPMQDGYILRYFQRPRLEDDLFELSKILRHAYPWIDLKMNMPPSPEKFELHLSGAGGLRDVLDNQLYSKVKKPFLDSEKR